VNQFCRRAASFGLGAGTSFRYLTDEKHLCARRMRTKSGADRRDRELVHLVDLMVVKYD
jgi:hypothetical protein